MKDKAIKAAKAVAAKRDKATTMHEWKYWNRVHDAAVEDIRLTPTGKQAEFIVYNEAAAIDPSWWEKI